MSYKLKWTRNTFRNLDFEWKSGSSLGEMSVEEREGSVDGPEDVRNNVVTKSSIQKDSPAYPFLYSICIHLELFSSNCVKQGTSVQAKICFRVVIRSWEEHLR